MGEGVKSERTSIAFLFLLVPALMLIIGYFIYPYPHADIAVTLIPIPIFLGLIFLLAGFLYPIPKIASKIKIAGWMVFAFYWATQPSTLYLGEEGDFVNAFICIAGVFVLSYVAYHEWLSIRRNERVKCLNWIAGAAAIAGLIYFGIERTELAPWLIESVAIQSSLILNAVVGNVTVSGVNIFHNGSYVVTIIFACTAVQAMVLFVGLILALPNVDGKRKIYGLLVTIIPVYFLNLLRNALVGFLIVNNITDFATAHNIIAKVGALLTLIILLLILIKIIPEIYDEIICVTELHKRKGPLEQFFRNILGRKK